MSGDISTAISMFTAATDYAFGAGFEDEIEWQKNIEFHNFSESDLLRESAWVILCSGFKEQIVRSVFDYISLCFCDWESAEEIVKADPFCRISALSAFRNSAKLEAISRCAEKIYFEGFESVKRQIFLSPLSYLQEFDFIGPVTAKHLAKNLGMNIAKPDRHLFRLSECFGFRDADHLCSELARVTGEKKNVIDLIIWRYFAGCHESKLWLVGNNFA
ncbi:hypothetical protein [Nisaea sediminum]|uniref:hypothetical protein n=1 Tax=Nisaea sediminum TaxID=2775867 RepID=UPI00186870A8|nr:hypothetical protein [Nisaea sediminum]